MIYPITDYAKYVLKTQLKPFIFVYSAYIPAACHCVALLLML